jgi:Tripartite tricarboxylate transporter TctB family
VRKLNDCAADTRKLDGRGQRFKHDVRRRDFYAGTLTAVIGAGVAIQSFRYEIGNLKHMRPGFFPLCLGVAMTVVGIAIAISPYHRSVVALDRPIRSHVEWRGWSAILLAVAAFVVLGRFGGLLPASFALVFLSALGDRTNTPAAALTLATTICAVCVIVFWWALRVPMSLFSWGQ